MSSRISVAVKTGLVASLALLLGGCSTVSFGSIFHTDGTATHSVTIMFLRGGLVDSDARRLERQFNAILERASADGYTAERLNTMTQTGVRVSTTTREVIDTGAALNSLYNSLTHGSSGPIAPFVGGFDREGTAVGGGQFSFRLHVDGDLLFRSIQEVSPGHRQLSSRAGVNEIVTFAYSVTMPGQVRDTNGELSGRNIVRWEIPLEGVTLMTVESNLNEDSPWLLIGLTIIAALIVVIAVAAVVAWVLIYHRNRWGSPVLAPASGAAMTMSDEAEPDSSVTVQHVGSSLARVVDRVISGPETDTSGNEVTSEGTDGAHPQRD